MRRIEKGTRFCQKKKEIKLRRAQILKTTKTLENICLSIVNSYVLLKNNYFLMQEKRKPFIIEIYYI